MKVGNKLLLSFWLFAISAEPRTWAEVTFVVTFEAGSKWYTESFSAEARTAMEAFFADVGSLFSATGTVAVTMTDNATTAYASTSSDWYDYVTLNGLEGEYYAPAAWVIINTGYDKNGPGPDVTVNWNLDVDALYGGDPNHMIRNFRGLGRHEMHHAFGEVSFFSHSTTSDPRGTERTATVATAMLFDRADAPILGSYNSSTRRFTVASYALNADWSGDNSGLYFAGMNAVGEVVPMPLKSYSTSIDFSHYSGISYVSDHPTWSTYEDPDFNFLRAMRYTLAIDQHEYVRVSQIDLSANALLLRFDTDAGATYRLWTSADLFHWEPAAATIPGTGSQVLHEVANDFASETHRFYRIEQVSP